MKWQSHQTVTLVTTYALTGDWLTAVAAMQGSIWPDAVERIIPGLSHRGLSHWFPVYVVPLFLLAHHLPAYSERIYPTLLHISTAVFSGHLPWINLLEGVLFWLLFGALMHIPEDSICGGIPIISPHQRFSLIRLFYVGSFMESVFTIAYMVIVLSLSCVYRWQ